MDMDNGYAVWTWMYRVIAELETVETKRLSFTSGAHTIVSGEDIYCGK
jgi:hypothetical protein